MGNVSSVRKYMQCVTYWPLQLHSFYTFSLITGLFRFEWKQLRLRFWFRSRER